MIDFNKKLRYTLQNVFLYILRHGDLETFYFTLNENSIRENRPKQPLIHFETFKIDPNSMLYLKWK